MFFQRSLKLSSLQSFLIINEVINLLRGGSGISYALRLLAETKNGNVQTILMSMEREIRNSVSIPDVFRKYGLIKDDEYSVLQGNNTLHENLVYVLKNREISSGFEKTVRNIFMVPLGIMFLLSFVVAIKSFPIKEMIDKDVTPFVERIFHVKDIIQLPFYLENPWYAWLIFGLILIIPSCVIIFYLYSRHYDIALHYKYFPKAYDDLPRIFRMIDVLSKNGKNQRSIARELSDFAAPEAIKNVFAHVASGQGKHYFYESFRENNFPKDICSMLENYETTGSLYQVVDKNLNKTGAEWLSEYSALQANSRKDVLEKYIKPLIHIGFYSFAIWILIVTIVPLGQTLLFVMTFMSRF